jgi:hypothetical protein
MLNGKDFGDHAVFSDCRTYRYALQRRMNDYDEKKKDKVIAWIMLNPSTADEATNDPTIRRVIGYSRDWGYDVAIVGNLFPYRATNPKELGKHEEAHLLGTPGINDEWLKRLSRMSSTVMFAWGTNGSRFPKRTNRVVNLLLPRRAPCMVLGYTKNGEPLHPLMCLAKLTPVHYLKVA